MSGLERMSGWLERGPWDNWMMGRVKLGVVLRQQATIERIMQTTDIMAMH